MDAVIEEIDGRMIRVGGRWPADFASCNYLGFGVTAWWLLPLVVVVMLSVSAGRLLATTAR
jgi:hypothetical protein